MASQQNQRISNICSPRKETKNKELRVGVELNMVNFKKCQHCAYVHCAKSRNNKDKPV